MTGSGMSISAKKLFNPAALEENYIVVDPEKYQERTDYMGIRRTGIIRRVDQLGRFVVPMELRQTMGIVENTPLEIFVDGDYIMLHKYDIDIPVAKAFDDFKQSCTLVNENKQQRLQELLQGIESLLKE